MSQQEADQLEQQQADGSPSTAEVIKSDHRVPLIRELKGTKKPHAAHSKPSSADNVLTPPSVSPNKNLISSQTIYVHGNDLRSSEPQIQIDETQGPEQVALAGYCLDFEHGMRSSIDPLGPTQAAAHSDQTLSRLSCRSDQQILKHSKRPSVERVHGTEIQSVLRQHTVCPTNLGPQTQPVARGSSVAIDSAGHDTLRRAVCLKPKGSRFETRLLEASTSAEQRGDIATELLEAIEQLDESNHKAIAGCERFARSLGKNIRTFFRHLSQISTSSGDFSHKINSQTTSRESRELQAKPNDTFNNQLEHETSGETSAQESSGSSDSSVSNRILVGTTKKTCRGNRVIGSSSCQSINSPSTNNKSNQDIDSTYKVKKFRETVSNERIERKDSDATRDCNHHRHRHSSTRGNKSSDIIITNSSPVINSGNIVEYTCYECLRDIRSHKGSGNRAKLLTGSKQSFDRSNKKTDAESNGQLYTSRLNKRRSTNCSWSVATNTDCQLDSSTSSVNNCSAAGCRNSICRDKMSRLDSCINSEDLESRPGCQDQQIHKTLIRSQRHSEDIKSCDGDLIGDHVNACGQSESQNRRQNFKMTAVKNDYRISMSSRSKLSSELTQYEPPLSSSPIKKRENWDKKIEFLLAVIGFAVDLGNVWRFPYICFRNGGGAFLIPYTIMFVLGGLPIFYLEMALGQYFSSGCLTIWKRVCPMAKGIGYAMCVLNFYTGLYYNTIISWAVFFFVESFTSVLPWTSCKNQWNTHFCKTIEQRQLDRLATNKSLQVVANTTETISSPTKDYYEREVLRFHLSKGIDDLGPIRTPLAIYLAIVFICIYFAIWKGVKSTGKAVWITALLPYFVLIPLLFRGVFLEGAWLGIKYYLYPDWKSIGDPQVWVEAAKQIYFSLGPGFGTLMALSSYNVFNHNCRRDALIAAAVNYFASFISGFVIFAVLGYMATLESLSISEVATEGPGLVFQVYPEGLAQMSFSPLWSILFFAMVITLGIDSTFGGLESVITGLCDEYPRVLRENRGKFIGLLIILIYLCSLPTTTYGGNYVIYVIESYGTSFSLLFIVLLETIVVCWVYGADRFCKNLEKMSGKPTGLYWRICWKYISPTILLIIFLAAVSQEMEHYKTLHMGDYIFPSWAPIVGILMTTSSVSCIPLFAIYYIKRKTSGTLIERLKMACTPIESNESSIILQQNMGAEQPT